MDGRKTSTTIILVLASFFVACVLSESRRDCTKPRDWYGVIPCLAEDINVPIAEQCLKDNGLNDTLLDLMIKRNPNAPEYNNLTLDNRMCIYACHAKYQLDNFMSNIPEYAIKLLTETEKTELTGIHHKCESSGSSSNNYCKYVSCIFAKYDKLPGALRTKIWKVLDPLELEK